MKHYLLTWYGITDFHATLGVDLQNVIAYGKGCQIACFCKHLELLLALMRHRGDEDEKFKMIWVRLFCNKGKMVRMNSS